MYDREFIYKSNGTTIEKYNNGTSVEEVSICKAYSWNEWINFPELVSLACHEIEFTKDFAKEMDSVLIGRNKVLSSGLFVDGIVDTNGKVKIRFRNLSSTTIPAAGTYLKISVIKY